MSKERFQKIKTHFENEAKIFDKLFFKVMPHYKEMMQSLVDSLPFRKNKELKMLELGCGTGNLTREIIRSYPNTSVLCLDMAENMIEMARCKLSNDPRIKFWLGDIRDYDYPEKYDAIAASMVLHHVEKKEKAGFYKKIYKVLKKGGAFFAIDIFLSSDRHLQKMFMDNWKKFMLGKGLSSKKVNEMLVRHQQEDRPVIFEEELDLLHKAGFKKIDTVLKYNNFALYGGVK